MPAVRANGITIAYERSGSGEPLLLIMGLGGQLIDWPDAVVRPLIERGFDVIRHDNRDAGLSTEFDWEPPSQIRAAIGKLLHRPVRAGYSIEDMADDAAALLEELDVGPAHVVGVSMGGMIAQSLAIRHPHRVQTLTSIMSNPGDGSGSIRLSLALRLARRRRSSLTLARAVERTVDTFRLISGPHFDEPELHARATAAVARSFRPRGLERQTAAILASPSRRNDLRRLPHRSLVVHGMLDPLVMLSGGIATARAIPDSRLLVFNDMGHDLPSHRIGELVDAIMRLARGDASVGAVAG